MRVAVWVVFLLVGALVPGPVSAQETATPVMTWEISEGPLMVEPLKQIDYEAMLHVSCATGSAGSAQPWTIEIRVEPVEGYVVSYRPTVVHVVVDPVACASGDALVSEPITFSISVHHSVPGGTTTDLILTAQEQSQEEAARGPLTVEVGPFFNYQVRLDRAIHKVQPGEPVRLDVVGTNYGNVDLLLKQSVGEGSSGALTLVWEDEWVLPAGQESVFILNVETGGGRGVYENRRDTVVLDIDAQWTQDPSAKGDPTQLTAVIQQQGSPALESPAPTALALAILAVAALAVLRRRR